MGLVAFSPIETLFAPPGEGHGRASGSQGLAGEFTDLLAALLGTVAGEPGDIVADQAGRKESVGSLLALLNAGQAKDDDKASGMPAMAALVASLLNPPAAPVEPSIALKQSEEPVAPAVTGAATATAGSTAVSELLTAPGGDDGEGSVVATGVPAVDAAASDGAEPASAQAVGSPLAPTTEGTTEPSSGTSATPAPADDAAAVATVVQAAASVPATEEAPTIPVTSQVDAPPGHQPVEVKADDGPDPAEPPATVTIQQGVVRFVGNAQKGKHEGEQDGPGVPEHERGVPRASAQGIAHASDNSAVAQLRTPAPETPPIDQVAPPPPAAEQPPAVEQVVQTVIEKVEEGGGEAHIRLDPPELGEVTIHVKISGGHIRVDVHAERAETMQMLREQALDLTSLLNGRGLDLTDVYVGLGGRQAPDARGDEDPSNRDRQGQGDEFRNLLGIDEEPAVSDRYKRLRSAYNPDGTHVYRI